MNTKTNFICNYWSCFVWRVLLLLVLVVGLMVPWALPVYADATYNACPTEGTFSTDVGTGGIITFNIATDCTIDINSEIAITTDTTIQNTGTGKVTLDGGNGNRIFNASTDGIAVIIDGLQIINGNVTGNAGAIVVDEGTTTIAVDMTFRNSLFKDNTSTGWGGIMRFRSSGTLLIENSVFLDNTAESGSGAIHVYDATAVIKNSAFIGNSAGDNKGQALRTFGSADVTFINSTISGHTGGGTSTTLHNGGGVGSSLTLINTTIVENTTNTLCSGTITDGGNNLADATCSGITTYSNGFNTTLETVLLGNTAPYTTYIHRLIGDTDGVTNLIDKGDNTTCSNAIPTGADSVDQLGENRTAYDGDGDGDPNECDLGAIEYMPPELEIASITVDNATIPQDASLVYTVNYINNGTGPAYDVQFAGTLDGNLDDTTLSVALPSHAGTDNSAGINFQWDLSSALAPGAFGSFEIHIDADPVLVDGTTIDFDITMNPVPDVPETDDTNDDEAAPTVTIANNSPPDAVDDTYPAIAAYTTDEDTTLNIPDGANDVLYNDSDPESDPFSISDSDATSANGASVNLNNANGSFSYNPTGSSTIQAIAGGSNILDTFVYTISDGNTDSATVTINVDGVNDAPVLDAGGSMTLTAIAEDVTDPTGDYVADIIDSAGGNRITDVDNGAVEGIAVTAVDDSDGTWQFSIDDGGGWTSFSLNNPTDNNATLLISNTTNTKIRFIPSADYVGSATITFRAWDTTDGNSNGNTNIDVSTNGGTTAYSLDSRTASITVNNVNDAPTVNDSTNCSMTTIIEDNTNPSANLVCDITACSGNTVIDDIDTGASKGIAVIGLSGTTDDGTWYFKEDNTDSWQAFPASVSDTNAVLLATESAIWQNDAQIRFIPNLSFNNANAMTVTFRAWDRTTTTEANGDTVNITVDYGTGGIFPFSTDTEIATIQIDAQNDAPIVSGDSSNVTAGDPAPATSPLSDQTENEPSVLTGFTYEFYVNDVDFEQDLDDLVLSVASSNTTLVPLTNISFDTPTPDGITRTITITPALYNSGNSTIQITVRDDSSDTDIKSFIFTVNDYNNGPSFSTVPGTQTPTEEVQFTMPSIQITDPDVGTATMSVTLRVDNGNLRFTPFSGITLLDGSNNSSYMVVQGTMGNLNTSLNNRLRYTSDSTGDGGFGYNGLDTLYLTVSDQGNTGPPGVLTATTTVNLDVQAVNDQPRIYDSVGNTRYGIEDTDLTITGLSIDDDSGLNTMQFSLSCSDGTITLNSTTGLNIVSGGDGTSSMTYQGDKTNINNAISSITYLGDPTGFDTFGFYGVDTITLDISDLGQFGSGGIQTDSYSFNVDLSASNDSPVIHVPTAQTTDEDTILDFGTMISITDDAIDNNNSHKLDVDLSTTNGGILTLGSTPSGLTVTGNGTNNVTLYGRLDKINSALTNITFTPAADYNQTDKININVDDNGWFRENPATVVTLAAHASIDITIDPVNDAPIITVPSSQNGSEDVNLSISGISISDDSYTDPDATPDDIEFSMTANNGTLTLDTTSGLSGSGNGTSSMTYQGTQAEINAALSTVTFLGSSDYYGSDTITILVDDLGSRGGPSALTDTATIAVTLAAVNDKPQITVPASSSSSRISVNEDTPLTFSAGNLITLVDDAQASDDLRVFLSATNGDVILGSTTGLSNLSGNGTGLITFDGTLSEINNALDGMTYQGDQDYNGTANIMVNINDNGSYGSGGSLGDTQYIYLQVDPVNDPPTVTGLPSSTQSFWEDESLMGLLFSVQDSDSNIDNLAVSAVSSDSGLIQNIVINPQTTSGDTSFYSMDITSVPDEPQVATNAAAEPSRTAIITITASDGTDSNTGDFTVEVDGKNDAPTLNVPSDQTVNEDTDLPISGISFSDIDAGTSNVRFTLNVNNGTIYFDTGATTGCSGINTATVICTRNQETLNEYLTRVIYSPDANYNNFDDGIDTMSVTINDLGKTGISPNNNAESVMDSFDIEVLRAADLQVHKSSLPRPVTTGESITYTIVVTNAGPSDISAVQIVDVFDPVELNNVSWMCSQANGASGCASGAGNNLVQNVSMPEGSRIIYTVYATVDSGAEGSIQNTVSVINNSFNNDPNPGNENSIDTNSTGSLVDLAINKVASSDMFRPGDPITYTLTFINYGPSEALGVVITDFVPSNVVNTSYTNSGATITKTGGFVWQVEPLNPNESGVITITGEVAVDFTTDNRFTNTTTIGGTDVEGNANDNEANIGVDVLLPRLTFGKIVHHFDEDVGTVNITATLDTAPKTAVSVQYTPAIMGVGSTYASAGVDFNNASNTINFAVDQTVQNVALTINEDYEAEETEWFYVYFDTPNKVVIEPITATIAITDNDGAEVIIGRASITVTENNTVESYGVRLNSNPAGMVTVTLTTDPIDHDQIEIGSLNHIAPFTNTTLVFHENNWLITQTIEITAINDDIQEITPKTVTLMHTSVSTNPDYNSIAIDDVVVQVVDEDVSNLLVSPLTLNISEDGMTANYDVVLNSEPTAPVTITISHDPLQTNLALTGVSTLALTNTLVFTSGNWHIAQTIIVTAVNDSWDETETHTSTIEHVITSDDPRYAALNQTVLVLIADNDTVGLIVSVTDIGLAEDGSITSTYQVYLASEPYNDVSVTIADMQSQVSYDQLTLSADTLYFTNLTWNIPQTVVVMAIDDTIDETSAQNSTILHHVTESDDQSYNESSNLGLTDINVLIIDNDEHGINIEPTDLVLSEDGITDTYQIVLTSEPYEVVNIIVSEGSGQVDLSNSNLNFTPSNWHVPQIIAVTARDDSAAEEDFHNAVITHTVNSDDPNYDIGYNSIFAQDVTAVIEDNDNFAVTVSKDLVDVTEDGITATYQIYLNSEPTGPVIITSTFDNMQVSISPMALTFLKSEWDIPRTIQVTAVNDDIDESEQHQTLVRHTAGSADPSYNDIFISPIYVDIADNDTVGIYVDETLLNVSENGITDSYTIVLNSEPTALVEIDMAIESPNLSASISPNQLTFNADTWDTPQTIVVSAIDDLIDETMPHTYTIAHTVISNDPKYDDFDISDVTISIEDNDTTDVTISRQFIHISESCIEDESVNTKSVNTRSVNACFDMYTIVLNSEPTSTVIITMTHDSEIIMSDTELAFTADNWDMPQPITVTAINDNWDETTPHTSTIAHFIQSDDPLYSKQILMNVYAVITDDDIVGVTISPTLFMLNEGDTDTYQISLDSEPTDVVTITVKANIDDSGGSMLALTSTMLVFSPTTWTEPQTVTLTVIDDNFDEPDTYQNIISHTITSNDLMYDMLTLSEVTITITDDDTYGVTISPTLFMLNEGDTDTYQINLNSEPTDVVTITLDLALSTTPPIQRGGAGGGVDLALTSTMLVFSPTTWTEPQTVTLTVIDDNFDEPDVYYNTITHAITSTDVMYGMLILPDVTIAITDDDTLGVTITPTQLTMLEGESGSYQISLNSRPTATVTIDMTPLSLLKGRGKGWGQISISHASIIFEPDSWTEIQTIHVTAIDDDIDEADTHASIIAHTSTSDDPQYNTSAQMQVTVIISDDDTANIVVSPTMLDIAEGEHGQTYSIVLESEPITTVAISINPDEQLNTIIAPADIGTGVGTINFNTVEFDKNNWHIPKYITVTAIDDPYVEELHTGVITQVVGSNDPNYNAFTMSNITATIIDNDSGELLIEPLSMFISEDGITDTYTMKLGSEPSASVFVTIKTTDEQLTVSPSSVRFDVTNWMIPHAVIVTANDDDQIEDELHMAVITNSVGSPDQLYDGIVVTMTAVITDNDELPQEIDLFVSKTVNKSMIELGQEIIYTIVVSNPSLSMATGVVLTDVLPNMANLGTINLPSPINIEMGSAILTQGTCNHNNDTGASKLTLTKVLCNLGTINPQSAVTISLHVTPTVDGGSGSLNISNDAVINMTNVVTATAEQPTTNLHNNVSSASTRLFLQGLNKTYIPLIIKPAEKATPTATATPTPTATPTVPIADGIDLVITDVQIIPESPQADVPATIRVTILNQGMLSVPANDSFFTDVYVDRKPEVDEAGNITWTTQGVELSAGMSQTLEGTLNLAGGSRYIYVKVDTDNNVDEVYEQNNVFGPLSVIVIGATATPTPTPIPPSQAPDLIVSNIRVEPSSPQIGEPATIIITIKNQGTESVYPTNNFFLDMYVDTVPQPDVSGNISWGIQGIWLNVGETVTFAEIYTFDKPAHELYAQVDTENNVTETDETNNVSDPYTIQVGGEMDGVDLVVTDVQILPSSSKERFKSHTSSAEEESTISITIKNQGNVDVGYTNNFFVDFYINGRPELGQAGNITWGVQGFLMESGMSYTLITNTMHFTGSSNQVYAQVDTDNDVIEINEDNNIYGPQNTR